MRSKSVAERPKNEDRTAATAPPRSPHASGALCLVRGAQPRATAMKKPGLY